MLSEDHNKLLTQVGPGTPMGAVFRRFWLPAAVSTELVADRDPVRLRILGEDLVAFRDTSGAVGIVDAYCSHRRAPLFFGRNEEGGLRCPYHGWKFDIHGQCVDLPNAGAGRDLTAARARVGITAYPAREAGGVVWIYMGPADKTPDLPALEWTQLPPEHVHVSRWLQRSNFMQGVEGEIDTSHVSWLHKEFDNDDPLIKGGSQHLASYDGAPELTLKEMPYGFTYGARRRFGDQHLWRVTQWMLPMFSLIPRNTDLGFTVGGGRAWVPVDDRNVMSFSYSFRADKPFSADELRIYEEGKFFPPRVQRSTVQLEEGHRIDTWLPVANRDNDYLVDREAQRNQNFTGIWGANEQDRALQESMGNIPGTQTVDRSRENLMASDMAVVTARRRLLKAARDLQEGIEPVPAGDAYAVRAISRICDITTFDAFLGEYGEHMRVVPYQAVPTAHASPVAQTEDSHG